jgi:hypothetical protein
MLSIGVFWPAAAGVVSLAAGVVARADADGATVGLADAATGGDKTAAAACGENGDAATSRVVTSPAPAST